MTVHIGVGEEGMLWLLPPAQSSERSSLKGDTRGLPSHCAGRGGALCTTKAHQASDLSFKGLVTLFCVKSAPALPQLPSAQGRKGPTEGSKLMSQGPKSCCVGDGGAAKNSKGDEGEKPARYFWRWGLKEKQPTV